MVYDANFSPINLSLCGCGFLGVYHVGVISAFKEFAPYVLDGKMAGCSAGSLVAACAMSGCCPGQMCSDALEIALRARSRALGPLHPTFSIVDIIRNGLRRILPTNAHEICSGRLHISLTRWHDNTNVIVNQFTSREELIQVLICSSFVPYWSGIIPNKYQGDYYWDGGLTNNNPIINENTILVSPFAGESDICPRDESGSFYSVDFRGTDISCTPENLYRMTHALFPPNISVLKQICWRGYIDAIKFLQTRNMVSSSYLSPKTNISSVFGDEYTEPANDEEQVLANGGIGEDVGQMYEEFDESEEEFMDDDINPYDKSYPSDIESNGGSQVKLASYCGPFLRKKELPTPLFAVFADARQKQEDPLRGYFTESSIYKVCSLMVLPLTLPFDLTCEATKRVLGIFRPSSDADKSSVPKRAVNYLWSYFSDENNDKYCYHVNDCACTESRASSLAPPRQRRKSQANLRRPQSTSQIDPSRLNPNRRRRKSTGISTVTSYRTDSSSDKEDLSTVNNDDPQEFSSETNLTQNYSQPDIVMSTKSNGLTAEYCNHLQNMATLAHKQRLIENADMNNEVSTNVENNVLFE